MRLLDKIKEKKVYVILIILVFLLLGVLISVKVNDKKYDISSTLLLIKTEKVSEKDVVNLGNLELSNNLISIFEEILKSDSNISEVKKELNLHLSNNEIKDSIKLEKTSKSDTFKIQVKNIDQSVALKINNKLIENFENRLSELYSNTEIYIVDNPHTVSYSYESSIIKIPVILTLTGILISLIYLSVLIVIEKNRKIRLEIEKEIGLKKLTELPLKNDMKKELISYESEKSLTSKVFKNLRTNIQFINVNNNEKNIILVTSPLGQEGKSYVSANLAISFAEVGKKVVLIDSDMLEGRQSKIFNIPNDLGFSNYLSSLDINGVEIKKLTNNFIKETAIKNLNLITSGTIPPNPSELLSSERLEQLIKDLSVFYDVVIIDSRNTLESIDALILSRVATSTILVSNYKKTKKEELLKSKKDIQNMGGRPIGIIINKIKMPKENKNVKKEVSNIVKKIKNNFEKIIEQIKQKREEQKQKLLQSGLENSEIINNKDLNILSSKDTVKLEEAKIVEKNESIEKVKLKETGNKLEKLVPEKSLFEETKFEKKSDFELESEINSKSKTDTNIEIKNENLKQSEFEKGFDKKELSKGISNNLKNLLENLKIKMSKKVSENDYIKNEEKMIKEKKQLEIDVLEKEENEKNNNKKFNIEKVKQTFINSGKKASENETKVFKKLKSNALQIIYKTKQDVKNEEIKTVENKENKEIDKENIDIVKNEKSNLEKINLEESKKKKTEIKQVDIKHSELIQEENNEVKEKEQINEKSENSILVVVDAEKGYCRVFSKLCFIEKRIKGVDKLDGFVKDQYSRNLINSRKKKILELYGINKKQVKKIDPVIYSCLSNYDDSVWIEQKRISNSSEKYVMIMTKEYEKNPEENEKDYLARCQRLRIEELEKEEIEIEYKLDNMWRNFDISLKDKLAIKYYSEIYEIKENLKNEEEIKKSSENKKFYVDVMQKAENELEKINQKFEEQEASMLVEDEFEKLREEMRLAEKEKQKQEAEKIKEEKRNQNKARRKERRQISAQKREEKNKKLEELRKQKEEEKERQKEEARIEEELLGDNLYPKTKFNKDI